jgi:hypothetical protein
MLDEDEPVGWDAVPGDAQRSIVAGWEAGFSLPPTASAIYGRWWQLETWLRSLCYVEMRARYGSNWAERLSKQVESRSARDRQQFHMPSPDAHDQLAFLDTGGLVDLIEDEWEIFDRSLLSRRVWSGRMEELLTIRNRIGHCRRPHSDDLQRLEQMLRDLEPGALRAIQAYNWHEMPGRTLDDPLVDAWTGGTHATARRLLQHAADRYDVHFRLRYTARPWADVDESVSISGQVGALWHACWMIRGDTVDIEKLWLEYPLNKLAPMLIFVTSPFLSRLEVSFPAIDDPEAIADAIGLFFDGILTSRDRFSSYEMAEAKWRSQQNQLDPRVQIGSAWSFVDSTTAPIAIFEA